MKNVFFALLTLVSLAAHAETLQGTDDAQVTASLVEGHKAIPNVGALTGSVLSVYAGSAYGLENYVVTVGNANAPCEGDDCLALKTFTVGLGNGAFHGPATAVYSRQIDANTYSIAILTTVMTGQDDHGSLQSKKAKILLRVKFHANGVEENADVQVKYL